MKYHAKLAKARRGWRLDVNLCGDYFSCSLLTLRCINLKFPPNVATSLAPLRPSRETTRPPAPSSPISPHSPHAPYAETYLPAAPPPSHTSPKGFLNPSPALQDYNLHTQLLPAPLATTSDKHLHASRRVAG